MKKRIAIILTVILVGCCIAYLFLEKSPSVIRFGLIADIQYGDCEDRGNRYYRDSLKKLDDCVADLNARDVQFTVVLGDLVDRSPDDFDPVLTRLNKLKAGVYNTTGNHDYHDITDNALLYKRLNMPDEYYSFKKGSWRFVVLNTNEIATYSNVAGTWKEKELADMLAHIKSQGHKNGYEWNGGISSRQMQWLKDQLDESGRNGENVLVLAHHPLYPASAFTALNAPEILEVLANYPCVKAVINGHHHAGAYGVYRNIPCITTEGMVEGKDDNAYGVVEITKDSIILTGEGRTKSYTIPLNRQ